MFDPVRGGAVCRRCAPISRAAGVRPLEPSVLAYLRDVAALAEPAAGRTLDTDARFTPADRIAARDSLIAMITGLVGRPLRSLEYMAKLGAAARREGS